jgi:hypothetical protein
MFAAIDGVGHLVSDQSVLAEDRERRHGVITPEKERRSARA